MKTNKDFAYYMKLPYPIMLFPPELEEDGWAAEVPLLSGCGTSAETRDEVLENIEIAKEMWLEMALEDPQPIPEPEPNSA